MPRGRESQPRETARHEADRKGEVMKNHAAQESGVALIVVMLVMLVFTVMLLGFYFVTTGEQKIAASDRDNAVAYYGAVGALEKMSSDVAAYFVDHAAPTPTQITNFVAANQPTIPGIAFATGGYTIGCTAVNSTVMVFPCSNVSGGLGSKPGTINGSGPLQGLQGIITPFTLTVIASGPNNTEVKMTRGVQEVAVPVFQFGIFSDTDLSFFAGPDFGFGGRVHTNGYLFLAEDGGTLTLGDHTTAAKDIIREQLSNGYVTGSKYGTTVNVLTTSGGCPGSPPQCRALGLAEGSVTGGPGSGVNSSWNALSLTTYNGWIRNGATGAKKLNLALALAGGSPIAMIQRPPTVPPGPYEDPGSTMGNSRFQNQASLRILLSDTQADINNLPAIDTTVNPYPLAEAGSVGWPIVIQRSTPGANNYYLPATDACHPPMAESPGYNTDPDYMSDVNTTLLGGYIKIEMQLNATPGTWQDVTKEILSLGISRDVAAGMVAPAQSRTNTSPNSLSSNTTYYYTVTAVLGSGVETPATVATEVSQSTSSSNKAIKLDWSGSYPSGYPGATKYRVYRSTSSEQYNSGSGDGYIVLTVGTAQTGWASPWRSFTDTGDSTHISGIAPTFGTPPVPCTNNSIVHLEEAAPGVALNMSNVLTPQSFVPINMYDAREGEVRDNSSPTTPSLNGIMNLVEIDVGKLQQWLGGNIGTSGTQALFSSGYILYVSDRRGNQSDPSKCVPLGSPPVCPTLGSETGEYGNEDIITPASTAGTPDGALNLPEEDVNGDGVFRTYGATPHPIAVCPVSTCAGSPWPAFVNSMPATNPAFKRFLSQPSAALQAEKNSVVVFRRALRLVNGTLGNLPPLAAAQANPCSGGTAGGFTVTSENPVYVQGDYNASVANSFNDATPLCHVPAAVIGDTVTLLSNAWTPGAQSGSGDDNSFVFPAQRGSRSATTTWYRMAIIGGKNRSFPQPSWGSADSGTDGGTHNFLRYDEDWGGSTLNYLGSMASFYISRQGTGIYKCCATVYNPPTRAYAFDIDFQNISKLPPGTPRFSDVNALSYYQSILASQ
jgi:hypothetical protein